MARSNEEHLKRARERINELHGAIDELEQDSVNIAAEIQKAHDRLAEQEAAYAELEKETGA